MYSKTLEPKIEKMFADVNTKISDIISSENSLKSACSQISRLVASETTTRSETMLSDMCNVLSTKVLNSLPNASAKNKFRYADLEQEISKKYNFSIPNEDINFKEANKIVTSLLAGAGTASIGGLLVYSLSPAAMTLPIALVIAASISAFCISYFKATPHVNKSKFKVAVNKYLMETKKSYIAWFDEVERYFNKRADEVCCLNYCQEEQNG